MCNHAPGAIAQALLLLAIATPALAHPKLNNFTDRSPAVDKIGVNLLMLEQDVREGRVAQHDGATRATIQSDAQGIWLDVVFRSVTPAVVDKIRQLGATVHHVSYLYQRASVHIDNLALIYKVAEIAEVAMVAPEYGAQTQVGLVTGQGVHALKVDQVQQQLGITGIGQKIGILSDSFARTPQLRDTNTSPGAGQSGMLQGSTLQDSGDLPASVQILRDDMYGADEGAAMAELIHDLAPDAALAFHTGFGSQALFAEGINALCTSGQATIVVDDIIYFAEPMFQHGVIAQAAAACVARGISYYAAAGNSGSMGLQQTYRDVVPGVDDVLFPATGNDLHDFGDGSGFLQVSIPANGAVMAVLQWNQPFQSVYNDAGAQIDLDMYFTNQPTVGNLSSPLSGSFNIQGTRGIALGDPVEIARAVNPTSAPLIVYLAIDHFDGDQDGIPQHPGTPLTLRLVLYGASAIAGTGDASAAAAGGPTVYGHAMAPGATAVGAVPWFDTPAYRPDFPPTANTDPEPFTSRGGALSVYFNSLGAFVEQNSWKPDLAAVDGADSTFFGRRLDLHGYAGQPDNFPNFFGTSAAAPHAAAVAALLRQHDPTRTPAQIQQQLAHTAFDVIGARASEGRDDVTGAGLIDAFNAIHTDATTQTNIMPTANAGPDITVQEGMPFMLDGSASSDPDGHLVMYYWAQTAGDTVRLVGADTITPRAAAPWRPQTLTFVLLVGDNDGGTTADSVNVVVVAPPKDNNCAHADATPFVWITGMVWQIKQRNRAQKRRRRPRDDLLSSHQKDKDAAVYRS